MPAGLMFSTVFYVSLLFTYEGCFSHADSAAAVLSRRSSGRRQPAACVRARVAQAGARSRAHAAALAAPRRLRCRSIRSVARCGRQRGGRLRALTGTAFDSVCGKSDHAPRYRAPASCAALHVAAQAHLPGAGRREVVVWAWTRAPPALPQGRARAGRDAPVRREEVSRDTNGPVDRLCLANGRATGPARPAHSQPKVRREAVIPESRKAPVSSPMLPDIQWPWRQSIGVSLAMPSASHLQAVAAEVDLRARIGAAAFQREDHALAELGVEHRLPRAQARAVAGARRGRPGAEGRRLLDAPGADDRAQAAAARPGVLVLTGMARAEAGMARRQPLQRARRAVRRRSGS